MRYLVETETGRGKRTLVDDLETEIDPNEPQMCSEGLGMEYEGVLVA